MADDLSEYEKIMDNYEVEIKRLAQDIQHCQDRIASKELQGINKESDLGKSLDENTRLKHRLDVLRRSIYYKINQPPVMPSICEALTQIFRYTICKVFPAIPDLPVIITLGTSEKLGDYQCNSAMVISAELKKCGETLTPRRVAELIVQELPFHEMIDKVSVAGAGFINVFLSKAYLDACLCSLVEASDVTVKHTNKQRIIVDFSSPNIAKQMHVGHLRSTIIGDSLCNLLEYLGHDVLRLNHLGDWGTQFGMLIAHLEDTYPDYEVKSPPIDDLQNFYRESKLRFDNFEDFKARAYECVVKLQSGTPKYLKAWKDICQVSRKEFEKIYERLGIVGLVERGESFYQSRMEKLVKELEERKLLIEDQGRKILWGEDDIKLKTLTSIPLTIVKSDGGFTYDTSDLATLKQRIEEEKASWIIYVTDAGQALHFQTLFSCARRIGMLDEKNVRVDHVQFGLVLGEDKKKFRTRSGDTVRLEDLLDEGIRRSNEKLVEKKRDSELNEKELQLAKEAVAYGCIKYADLSHNRNHDYVFSFDKMLEDRGNTAVYLLYNYTRIRAIERNAVTGDEKSANGVAERLQKWAKNFPISLEHEKELRLAKLLVRFPDELFKVTTDLCMHHLCEYLYSLATGFSEFYDCCYCIERNDKNEIIGVNEGRLLLIDATRIIMQKCFNILGLKTVDKM